MNKDQYFNDLEEIITDPIFIGSTELDLQKEIETNMWRITIQQDLDSEITSDDFKEFIFKIIKNRQEQIDHSNSNSGMFFYLWFDWMASQLRFNLISDLNKKLPFSCEFQIVNDLKGIIDDILISPFHNGLLVEEFDDESDEKEFVLKIYKLHLIKQ